MGAKIAILKTIIMNLHTAFFILGHVQYQYFH